VGRHFDDYIHEPDRSLAAVADAIEENVGAALQELHAAGIIHLDVAPNNILKSTGYGSSPTQMLAQRAECSPSAGR
jgi:tRNA A-37 threonylcarbamoyl transferase component Bud32